MSHRNLAIGTLLLLVSFIAIATFLTTTSLLQTINPIAALTAFTVALIGIVWFKKTKS